MDGLENKWKASIAAGFIQGLSVFICYALVSAMIPNILVEITRLGVSRPEAMSVWAMAFANGHFLGLIIWAIISIVVFILATFIYRLTIKSFVSEDGNHPKAGLIVMCGTVGCTCFTSLIAFFISQNSLFAFTWFGMIAGAIMAVLLLGKIATPTLITRPYLTVPSWSLRDIDAPKWALEKARSVSDPKIKNRD